MKTTVTIILIISLSFSALGDILFMVARASVFALAKGADKLFYINNWLHWDNDFEEAPKDREKRKKGEIKKYTHLTFFYKAWN